MGGVPPPSATPGVSTQFPQVLVVFFDQSVCQLKHHLEVLKQKLPFQKVAGALQLRKYGLELF